MGLQALPHGGTVRVPLKLGLLLFWVLHARGPAGNDRNCSVDMIQAMLLGGD